ncbi:ribosome silencing factor [Tepidimonas taiwanensis]|uniref:Ribosomal silencing factor RsfS n=1 Tax=Tepidimonas taiwanensis TaxID=307486 RepID=A0A554XBB2_9BURK|nr:ribosome silencing factor [Tepidimonas taiwanensis]TSE33125.1 Ribosomal silencing factor RsfS [Tepidimonas taiwanensis]UBQ05969.1 ribosome silencing factor [Tepidimonas taiwanensis]
MSETAAQRQLQRLQRAIVDGLEDVKAQDIQVFNTAAMTPLFERVVIASGTSNRQTKALAASVRDKVVEAGFAKPRTEGEDNGEWIIIDCGTAVVHVMQPAIRQYYRLEEIWGGKPVRLRKAPAPAAARPSDPVGPGETAPRGTTRRATSTPRAASPVADTAPSAKKPATTRTRRASPKASATDGAGATSAPKPRTRRQRKARGDA